MGLHTKKAGQNGTVVTDASLQTDPAPGLLCLETLHPHVRALIEGLLLHEATLARYRAGTVRLHYHRERVKVTLELVL